jgi:hypothetical protein
MFIARVNGKFIIPDGGMHIMKNWLASVAIAASLSFAPAASALASVFVTSATDVGVVKVFGSGGSQVSNTVTGVVDGTSNVVNFSSSTLLSLDGAGYAQISGVTLDGFKPNGDPKYKAADYSNFNIALANPLLGFTAIEFNGQTKGTIYADITANLAGGGSVLLSDVLFNNGENNYRIYSTGSDIITSLNFLGFTTTGGSTPSPWTQFKQVDIAAVTIPVTPPVSGVPEPATWAMLIVGFGAIGAALRSRRKLAFTAA